MGYVWSVLNADLDVKSISQGHAEGLLVQVAKEFVYTYLETT